MSHARYAPSAAERWSLCPGSPRLIARAPVQPPARWTIEGTRAHALLQLCLAEREPDAFAYEGLTLGDEPWVVDREHCASVQVCLDFVFEILERHPDAELYVERYLPVPQTVVPSDDCGGTADICIYIPSLRRLYVIDFKHGEGVTVEIHGNKQVRCYALAALEAFPDPIDDICLTIVQPRAFHPMALVRSEIVLPRDLVDFQGQLEGWISACESADAPLIAGETQCRFCPVKAFCPALQGRALELFGAREIPDLKNALMPVPEGMAIERISTILTARERVNAWFDAVEKYAREQIAAGNRIPGWKLVLAQERRRWDGDPKTIAEQFMQLTGCDLDDIFPRKLIGITEAEKMVKVAAALNIDKAYKKQAVAKALETMAHLTVKESSGNLVLVSEADARPAVNAAGSFSEVKLPHLRLVE